MVCDGAAGCDLYQPLVQGLVDAFRKIEDQMMEPMLKV
jgi:hypothetical protein